MWIKIEEIIKTHPEGARRRNGHTLVRKTIGLFKNTSDSYILDQTWIVLGHTEHARRVKVINRTPTTIAATKMGTEGPPSDHLGVTIDVIDPDLLDELTLPDSQGRKQQIEDVLKHHKIWWPA